MVLPLARAHFALATAVALDRGINRDYSFGTFFGLTIGILLLLTWLALRRAFDACAKAQRSALNDGEQVQLLAQHRRAR